MAVLDPKDEATPSPTEDSVQAGQTAAVVASLSGRSSDPRRDSRTIASLRVGALGASAWFVAVLVPLGEGGLRSWADLVLVLLPILALGLGTRFFVRERAEATPLLAIAFPGLVATAMAGRADPALSEHYAAPIVILSGLTMLAYVAATAHALARPSALRETRVSKLAVAQGTTGRERFLRWLVLGTTSVFALAMAIVAPAIGSRAVWSTAWGEAADEGRVLVAIIGAAAGTVALTVIVGPALRAPRQGEGRTGGDGVAIATSIVLAVTGAMAWAILRFLERQ